MTDNKKSTSTSMTASPPEYEVGYGKPPTKSQFKPGVSGNPNGRPRGSKNKAKSVSFERIKEVIIAEAYREIDVREGDKVVSYPLIQATVRSLATASAKGDRRAQKMMLDFVVSIERERELEHRAFFEAFVEYKHWAEKQIADRKRLGVTGPEIVPHPDDIIIDPRNGVIKIVGPMTREEKADYERFCDLKSEIAALAKKTRRKRNDCAEASMLKNFDHAIEKLDSAIERIDTYNKRRS